MAGPFVRDTNAAELFTAAVDLNTAGSTTSAAVEVNKPGDIVIELATATVASTGDTATLDVNVEGANESDFSDKVEVASFPQKSGTDAAQSDQTFRLKLSDVIYRYLRVVVTLGGTAPDYTGSTCKVRTRHYRQNLADDTA